MNKLSWKPETVEQCMVAIEQLLTAQENDQLIKSSEDDLIMYHHGLGRWIRNNWDLWQGGPLLNHMKTLGFTHPDDMSQSLIEEYWALKNNKPSTMKERIAKYAAFWAEQESK